MSKNHMNLTKMFKGFRIPDGKTKPLKLPKHRIQYLLAQDTISYDDNILVAHFTNKCTSKNFSKQYLDNLETILSKDIAEAKIDGKGEAWERSLPPPVPVEKEEENKE